MSVISAGLVADKAVGNTRTGEVYYTSVWYRATYEYDGEFYIAVFRMNLPAVLDTPEARLAIFILGGRDADVECSEGAGRGFHDEVASLLATGFAINTGSGAPISPRSAAIVTLQFIAPGRGVAACAPLEDVAEGTVLSSDGDPAFMGVSPNNPFGDDLNGELTYSCITAIIELAEGIIRNYYGDVDIVKVVSSHSNGVVLGARLAAERDDLHAFIDAERPTDSLEQTVSTECYDPFGVYDPLAVSGCPSSSRFGFTLPRTLTLSGWMQCRGLDGGANAGQTFPYTGQCGGHTQGNGNTYFENAWGYFFRPPTDVLDEALDELSAGVSLGQPSVNLGSGMDFDWSTVLTGEVTAFWSSRSALELLPRRQTPYLRINCAFDHVQPVHYKNRHATRALLAAATCNHTECPASDVYWLKTVTPGETATPVRFSAEGVDADSLDKLLVWPDTCGPANQRTLARDLPAPLLEGAMIRWAFEQDFGYTGLRDCVNRCGASPYCDDDDARLACVEACVETERRLRPATPERVTAWYGYASFTCSGLFGAVEACGDRYPCDYADRMACVDGALDELGALSDFFRGLAEDEYPWVFSDIAPPACGPMDGAGPRRDRGRQGPTISDAATFTDALCETRCTGANRRNWSLWCFQHCDEITDAIADGLPRGVLGQDDALGWQDFDFDEHFGSALRS